MSDGGLTRTERYLARLARRSFLSLWSHPNLYRDRAKELCDLLVVCHNIVIIFSDKEVKLDKSLQPELAWSRWYNRAVKKSVPQLRRAKGWIESHPDRIFRDAKCTLPANLFERVEDPLEIHLIAVANGASEACLEYFDGGSGSLLVDPDAGENPPFFTAGNPGELDLFVHVFDEAHLHIILQELDTIKDFSEYLQSRQKLIENKNLFMAASEEDLLATYLKDVNDKGMHDFVWSTGKSIGKNQKIVVVEGSYKNFRNATLYRRKKKADRVSYVWDRLIEKFARNILKGTLADVPESLGLDGKNGGAELGLRFMALERRIQRRAHSQAILGAFDNLEKRNAFRFFRAMIPQTPDEGDTGFCILLVDPNGAPDGTSFDDYRAFRAANLGAYTGGLLERNRHLKRVIGIATEGHRRGKISEDLIYHERPNWNEEAVAETRQREKAFDIFKGELNPVRFSTSEYPKSAKGLSQGFSPIPYSFRERPRDEGPKPGGNRRQRRAAASGRRKK